MLSKKIKHQEVVPSEWEVAEFFKYIPSILDFRGRTPKKLGMEWGDGKIPALSANNVKMGYIDFDAECYVGSNELYKKWMTKGDLEPGDVLFTMEAPLGNVAQVPDSSLYILSQRVVAFKTDNRLDSTYFKYYLMSPFFQNDLYKNATGTTAKGISQKNLSLLKVIVPPIKEQQKIAEILSTVDEQIDYIRKLIKRIKELKKGLLKELLTKGVGHTKLKPTPLGEIPIEWEVKELGEIADIKGGKRLPKGRSLIDERTSRAYIRVSDMYMGGIDATNVLYVPEDVVPSIERYRVFEGDIVISVAGTLGLVGEIPKSLHGANLTENADRICNIKCDKTFLKYYLMSDSIQKVIENEKTQNAQPKLALTRIKSFKVILPTYKEQQKISKILSAVDSQIDSLQLEEEKYLILKKGLMQQLLTGKVRVKV